MEKIRQAVMAGKIDGVKTEVQAALDAKTGVSEIINDGLIAGMNIPQIVGLSALLTTTMPVMKETIDLLECEGLRGQVQVMIGGAPVSQEYADEIGANAYAPDAAAAVELARQIVA